MIKSPQYVLDTDTCIYLLNGNQRIKEFFFIPSTLDLSLKKSP
jgi:hypothetical protein